MSTALLLISDGREDYLGRTLVSAEQNLPAFDHFIHVDDAAHELGFAGAIKEGWRRVLETDADYIFHLEQDFEFLRPIPLDDMIGTLEANRNLIQMALLRQPWNKQEQRAGSLINVHPECYEQQDGYIRHRRFFTTNPSVYPRWIAKRGWTVEPESEGWFGIRLFSEEPNRYSAFWGNGEEWVHHIGDERKGTGY